MKKNRILGLASAIALLAAGACSNEMIDPNKNQGGLLNTDDNAGGVYMTVDFKMPTGNEGTRSETEEGGGSTGGTEVGSDAENNVTSALIVLAFDKTEGILNPEQGTEVEKYGFIVAGEVFNNHISHVSTSDNSNMLEASAKLNKNNLNRLYSMFYNETTQAYNVPSVYVFVFCNPTQDLRALFASADGGEGTLQFGSASWIDATCKVIQNGSSDQNVGIWSPNSFLMNNKTLTTRDLPKKLLDWENFSSYEKAFHLSDLNQDGNKYDPVNNSSDVEGRGAVLVERSVARFDFKDGSKLGDNQYNVLYAMDDKGDVLDGSEVNGDKLPNSPIAAVQLQKMCLVNMGNQFYYLPRVSRNGQLDGEDYALCGREKPWIREDATGEYRGGNYVVGPYADVFRYAASQFGYDDSESDSENDNPFGSNYLLGGKKLSEYFNFPFFDDNGLFNQDMNIGSRWDVVKIDDVTSNGNKDNYDGQKYNVWRYVVENIIPAGTENQVNGISTGVVFKAQMIAPVMEAGAVDASKYDEYWDPGYAENLKNCLNGDEFTYNGEKIKLKGNSKDDPILYYKDGKLYMGWRHMRQAAIQESVTRDVSGKLEINSSTALYQAVFGNGPIPAGQVYIYKDGDDLKSMPIEDPRWKESYGTGNGGNEADYLNYLKSPNYLWSVWSDGGKNESIDDNGQANPALANMRKAIVDAGTTIYQSSTDADFDNKPGYYCYYYYWNRHNDNNMNGSMGPMEFDVVRNNVYKLSVDKIARLGHPRIPENDPQDPDPGTKDESDDIYLDVKVQIMPWVVRVNNIQF